MQWIWQLIERDRRNLFTLRRFRINQAGVIPYSFWAKINNNGGVNIGIWTCIKCYLIAFWIAMGSCMAKLFYDAYAYGLTYGEYVSIANFDKHSEMHAEFLVITISLFLTVIYCGYLLYRDLTLREDIDKVLRDRWELFKMRRNQIN